MTQRAQHAAGDTSKPAAAAPAAAAWAAAASCATTRPTSAQTRSTRAAQPAAHSSAAPAQLHIFQNIAAAVQNSDANGGRGEAVAERRWTSAAVQEQRRVEAHHAAASPETQPLMTRFGALPASPALARPIGRCPRKNFICRDRRSKRHYPSTYDDTSLAHIAWPSRASGVRPESSCSRWSAGATGRAGRRAPSGAPARWSELAEDPREAGQRWSVCSLPEAAGGGAMATDRLNELGQLTGGAMVRTESQKPLLVSTSPTHPWVL